MSTNITLYQLYRRVTIFNLIIFPLLYLLIPDTRGYFTREDSFMENLTVILFLESFILGFIFVFKLRKKIKQKIYSIFPLLGLIGVLDELSFGERIFNFTSPIVGEKKIDGIHDFISFFYYEILELDRRQLMVIISMLSILFVFLFKLAVRFDFLRIKNILKIDIPFKFVVFLIFFATLATFCDLDIIRFRGRVFLEELFEMNVALSLLFVCCAISTQKSNRSIEQS